MTRKCTTAWAAYRKQHTDCSDEPLTRSPSPINSFSRKESFSPGGLGHVPKLSSFYPQWLLHVLPSISVLHMFHFGAELEQVRACCSCWEERSQLLAIVTAHRGLFLHITIEKQLPTLSAPPSSAHSSATLPEGLPHHGIFIQHFQDYSPYGCFTGCSQHKHTHKNTQCYQQTS